MKKLIIILSTLILLVLSIVLGNYFDARLQAESLRSARLEILPVEKNFVEEDDLKKDFAVKDSLLAHIDVAQMEKSLKQNAYLDKAEVYKDLNGHLVAIVEQYHPIARVLGATSYYIDKNGEKKPLSNHYTENVVLVFGSINKENKKATIDLIQAVHKDEVLHNIVSEIHIKSNGYKLRVKDVSSGIVMSDEDMTSQLLKLKEIYAYITAHKMQHKYQKIDLRYKNQVVCK